MGSRHWLTAIAAVVLSAGCGGSSLTAEENLRVAKAQEAISFTILDGSQYAKTLQGVDDLIRICRSKPDATYEGIEGKVTMRQLLEDEAGRLDRYRGSLADRLSRAAAAGCK